MSIYQFSDYRAFLKDHLKKQARGGRGELGRLALVLGVHSTFVSLVFKGKRDLSIEQSLLLARDIQLTENETDYFLNLVQLARAGHHQLKTYFADKITAARESSKKLENRFEHDRKLAAEEREIFYSSWHYSAIRLYCSTTEGGRSVEEICGHFRFERPVVVAALEFLRGVQLVVEKKDRYGIGPQRTYLEKGNPLLKCHHTNWRLKGLGRFADLTTDEMMFTSPLSISKKDFAVIRELLATAVQRTSEVLKETEPEEVACLNIDFFYVR